jgi:hypothetical protein
MNDDSFAAGVRRFDPEYGGLSGDWMFKRENADGYGPGRGGTASIRSGRGGEQAGVSETERERRRRATMAPASQEIWKNELVGRFKVDRLAVRCKSFLLISSS